MKLDNQLRGRAGRQGDPGSSQCFLPLEDDLLRKFGGSRLKALEKMLAKGSVSSDAPIQAASVSRAILSAQRQVEDMRFAARKRLLEYNDVMNAQRAALGAFAL